MKQSRLGENTIDLVIKKLALNPRGTVIVENHGFFRGLICANRPKVPATALIKYHSKLAE